MNVAVKILSLDPIQPTNVRGKIVNKQETIAGDNTGSIKLTLRWNLVNTVTEGSSVKLSHLSTRLFSNEKTLSATEQTRIEKCDDITCNEDYIDHINHTWGIIQQIVITKNLMCSACFKKIPDVPYDSKYKNRYQNGKSTFYLNTP